jgi:hypothetical protein
MANATRINPDTGQLEDDPNAPIDNPSGIGSGTGVNAPPAPPPPAPAAFDRTQFRDASMSRAQGQSPQDFINANQGIAGGVTSYNGSKDKFVLPTGEVIDLSINADANGVGTANGWTGTGFNAQGVADTPGGGAGGPMAGAGAAGGPGGTDFQAQIRQMLLAKMGQMSAPVDGSDPIISGQTDAYRNEQSRGADRQRAVLAERAAADGSLQGNSSSGGFDSAIQGIQEQAATKTGDFKTQLMGRELENRRASLNQLMQMALQTGDAESARTLQMQLAQIDDQTKRLGLSQNQSQFNDTFGAGRADRFSDDQYRNAKLTTGTE